MKAPRSKYNKIWLSCDHNHIFKRCLTVGPSISAINSSATPGDTEARARRFFRTMYCWFYSISSKNTIADTHTQPRKLVLGQTRPVLMRWTHVLEIGYFFAHIYNISLFTLSYSPHSPAKDPEAPSTDGRITFLVFYAPRLLRIHTDAWKHDTQ